jgi:hypothetical protein
MRTATTFRRGSELAAESLISRRRDCEAPHYHADVMWLDDARTNKAFLNSARRIRRAAHSAGHFALTRGGLHLLFLPASHAQYPAKTFAITPWLSSGPFARAQQQPLAFDLPG